MKKYLINMLVMAVLLGLAACQKKGACRIHGIVNDAKLNGSTIFLVPLTNDNPSNVDSVKIENGTFEMTTDTLMIAQIIIDYHVRFGTQTLLVVTEPGDVNVAFGAVSSGGGTPLNDSLQAWKMATERHNSEYGALNKQYLAAEKAGSQEEKERLKAQADSVHLAYKKYSRQMAGNLKETLLGDFLNDRFPLKYKRMKADSTVVWVDADTNEELGPVTE